MGDDELALLDQWCAGDAAAGNALFRRHFAAVYRFFEHKIDGEVDELVQETFLACLRGRDRFRRQSTFRTYIFAIARNTLYGYWRQRAGRGPVVDFDEISIASLSTSLGSRMARREERQRLLEALRTLPLDQQLLLELHYWEELERDQLAEVFDVEPATTRSRLFRARQALRERLAAGGGAAGGGAAGGGAPAETAEDDLDAWARGLRPDDSDADDADAPARPR